MSSNAASYKNVTAHENSRLHAGHVYNGNVVNNFGNHSGVDTDEVSSASTSTRLSQTRSLAPADSRIHEEFCQAAREGQLTARLEYLLAQGANIDAKDKSSLTALYYAAARGDIGNVKFLLNSGADVNPQHEIFMTPIWIAALRCHPEVFKVLLENNAKLSGRTRRVLGVMGTLMHCAFYGGSTSIVKCLLETQGWPTGTERVSIVAFHKIAEERFSFPAGPILPREPTGAQHDDYLQAYEDVSKSLTHCEWHVDRAIRCSPVLLAVECSHFRLLQFCWPMLDPISDTWECGSFYSRFASNDTDASNWSFMGFQAPIPYGCGSTLLMWAAVTLKLDLIDHLLSAGASVDERDMTGKSAIHYAVSPFQDANFKDIGRCVQRLVESGALVSMTDGEFEMLLKLAVNPEHPAIDPRISSLCSSDPHRDLIKSVLDNVICPQNKRTFSRMALQYALSHADCPLGSVELLCTYGASLDSTIEPTPLAFTQTPQISISSSASGNQNKAEQDKLESAQLKSRSLDSYNWRRDGTDPDELQSMTPLQIAVARQASGDIIATLLKYGADPTKADDKKVQLLAKKYRERNQAPAHFLSLVEIFGRMSQATRAMVTCSRIFRGFSTLPSLFQQTEVPGQSGKSLTHEISSLEESH